MKRLSTVAEVTGCRYQQDLACVQLDRGHVEGAWQVLWFCVQPLDAPNEILTGSTVRNYRTRDVYADFVYRDPEAA